MADRDKQQDMGPLAFSLEEEEKILQARLKVNRRAKRKVRTMQPTGALNINSMMDLMTIILVFILLTSKTQNIQPEMTDELYMPWSSSELSVDDAMVITITKESVMVNNSLAVIVHNGNILESDRVSNSSPIIPELQSMIEDVLENESYWANIRQDMGEQNVATIVADHSTSYEVLTYVMMTASAAGVQNFKFAILRRDRANLFSTSAS